MTFVPRRSVLSVPAHIEKMAAKAAGSNVDVIMFDLEDSVPVDKKAEARTQLEKSLKGNDWSGRTLSFRCNPVESEFCYEDIITIASSCGDLLDTIVIPKVDIVADVHFVDKLLDGVEKKFNIKHQIGIEISVESAEGLENLSAIAKASSRIKTLVFGIADYTTSIEARLVSISGHGENEEELYPGHRWHYVLSKMVMTAKANNLMAIDAAYGNFRDLEGLRKSALISSALGCNGKWAIHPGQVDVINEVYTPSNEEIERAKMIVAAEEEAISLGKGAVSIDGRMVDKATIRLAKKQLEVAARLGLT